MDDWKMVFRSADKQHHVSNLVEFVFLPKTIYPSNIVNHKRFGPDDGSFRTAGAQVARPLSLPTLDDIDEFMIFHSPPYSLALRVVVVVVIQVDEAGSSTLLSPSLLTVLLHVLARSLFYVSLPRPHHHIHGRSEQMW